MFDLQNFINKKHLIKYSFLEKYIEKLGGKVVNKCKKYNGIDKFGHEDEYTIYLEFYIENDIKLLGYFHDISSYDEQEQPIATFSIIND